MDPQAGANGRLGVMDDWMGIVVALAVGVPLLVVAVLVDRRRRRTALDELAEPPLRSDHRVDGFVPVYISQGAVDALPAPGGGARAKKPSVEGARLAFGHLDEDFATAGSVAELRSARVLMVGDPISSLRELLVPLGEAASGQPLVIAATSFHPEVLASLKANRRVVQLPVVAVEANLAELMQLQDLVGGQVLSAPDLKAGWIPPSALGFADHWSSDLSSSWVVAGRQGQR